MVVVRALREAAASRAGDRIQSGYWHVQFGAIALSERLSEEEMQKYQQRKGELQEQITSRSRTTACPAACEAN